MSDSAIVKVWAFSVLGCVVVLKILHTKYKIKLTIEHLPTSKAESAASGLAEFQGYTWATNEGVLVSPLFGQECLAYRTTFYHSLWFDRRGRKAISVLKLKNSEISKSKPFYLLDESGMVLVEAGQNIDFLKYAPAGENEYINFAADKRERIKEFLKEHKPSLLKNIQDLVVSEEILTEKSVCYLKAVYSRGSDNLVNKTTPQSNYVEFLNEKRDEFYKAKTTEQESSWKDLFEPQNYTKRITADNYLVAGAVKTRLNSKIIIAKTPESKMREINGENFYLKITAACVCLLILIGIPIYIKWG